MPVASDQVTQLILTATPGRLDGDFDNVVIIDPDAVYIPLLGLSSGTTKIRGTTEMVPGLLTHEDETTTVKKV